MPLLSIRFRAAGYNCGWWCHSPHPQVPHQQGRKEGGRTLDALSGLANATMRLGNALPCDQKATVQQARRRTWSSSHLQKRSHVAPRLRCAASDASCAAGSHRLPCSVAAAVGLISFQSVQQ